MLLSKAANLRRQLLPQMISTRYTSRRVLAGTTSEYIPPVTMFIFTYPLSKRTEPCVGARGRIRILKEHADNGKMSIRNQTKRYVHRAVDTHFV